MHDWWIKILGPTVLLHSSKLGDTLDGSYTHTCIHKSHSLHCSINLQELQGPCSIGRCCPSEQLTFFLLSIAVCYSSLTATVWKKSLKTVVHCLHSCNLNILVWLAQAHVEALTDISTQVNINKQNEQDKQINNKNTNKIARVQPSDATQAMGIPYTLCHQPIDHDAAHLNLKSFYLLFQLLPLTCGWEHELIFVLLVKLLKTPTGVVPSAVSLACTRSPLNSS